MNNYDLIAERDKYRVDDVQPRLSGWAQINGRDTVEIEDKARFDGEYVGEMGLKTDVKCLFGAIVNVLKRSKFVEGGTATIKVASNNKAEETVVK